MEIRWIVHAILFGSYSGTLGILKIYVACRGFKLQVLHIKVAAGCKRVAFRNIPDFSSEFCSES
jgi:hypothetical protein